MFSRLRIGTKLAAAVAVPLLALAGLAAFEVADLAHGVQRTRAQTDLATSAVGPGSLLTRMQDERNRAAIDLIGLGGATDLPVRTNAEARRRVDEAAEALRADLAGRSDAVRETFEPAFRRLGELEGLRADIDAFRGPMDISNTAFADEVFARYTAIVESMFDATSRVALQVDDSSLRNGVQIVDAAARQSEMRARLVREIVLLTLTGEASSPEGLRRVAVLADRAEGFDEDITASATGAYEGIADATFQEGRVRSFNAQVAAFLAGGEVDITALLDSVRTRDGAGYTGLRDRATAALRAQADYLIAQAERRQQLFAGMAAAMVALASGFAWAASRSITGPLRSLRAQAEEMANKSLPAAVQEILDTPAGEDVEVRQLAPVVVGGKDEVSEVAQAINVVQRSALALAAEQAVLRRHIAESFVNLGRRNQNLLNRQLDFITQLEQDETDPDSLDGLFKLDHLATRMRRNAESLLVLAGADPSRRWGAPVKLPDVVRAALGEVEDYQRVLVRHLAPASVAGSVAADLAHVLAELIENALAFSPPEEPVEVKGRLTPEGYTLAICDNGIGMPPAELERANRRLAGQEAFTVAPSRYLGHYVAGHLARRIGATVVLQDSPAGGITSRVDLPMSVLAVLPEVAAPSAPWAAGAWAPGAGPSDLLGGTLPEPSTQGGLPRRRTDLALAPPIPPPALAIERAAGADMCPDGTSDAGSPEPAGSDADGDGAPVDGDGSGADGDGSSVDDEAESAHGASHGLPKRVPGAQRPDRLPVRVREDDDEGAATAPVRSVPQDVQTFLSSFHSGLASALAEAHPGAEEEREEEDHR